MDRNVLDYNPLSGNASDAINAAIQDVNAEGGGMVYIPEGIYTIPQSIRLDGCSNVRLCGAGNSTLLVATEDLDGGGDVPFLDTSEVISCLNFSDSVQYPDWHHLVVENLRIDCSRQNTSGIYTTKPGGPNMCAIQFMNANHVRVSRVRVENACGNGIVIGSQDPTLAAAVANPVIEECEFYNCISSMLPQYGATGACMQVGAALGGRVRGCFASLSGGPLLDIFNCYALVVDGNYSTLTREVPNYTKMTSQGLARIDGKDVQEVGGINGGFGLRNCVIRDNTLVQCGGIRLSGNPAKIMQTKNTPTPGPQYCVVQSNTVQSPVLKKKCGIILSGWSPDPKLPDGTIYGNRVFSNTATVIVSNDKNTVQWGNLVM